MLHETRRRIAYTSTVRGLGEGLPSTVSSSRAAVFRVAGLVCLIALASGCEPFAVTMAGVGTATGVNHALGGIVYKTFTEPLPRVNQGTLAALKRMAIKVDSVSTKDRTETIAASARERRIEIELEAISPKATRMRAVARQSSGLWDTATATEIILQTEKSLGSS